MAPWTTPTKKAKICTMKKQGASNDAIRAALGDRSNLTNRSINHIFKRYGGKENYYDVGHSTGRPRKLSDRDRSASNASDLSRKYFPQVSTQTMRRALRQQGLESHHKATVPFISTENQKKRLNYANNHSEWTTENWNAVLFSDESIFRVFGSDGIEWCWRRPNEGLDPRFTKKKVKHGGGKVTVWGMITPYGVGRLVRIEGNMNAPLYCEILEDDFLGTLSDLGLRAKDYYFQQDNDPKHTAKMTQTWFRNHNIDVLDWPPSSPDLNIIENLWDYLEHMVRSRDHLPTSEDELWEALQEEWYSIPQSYIERLYVSLPQRIRDVKAARGGNTRY